MQNRIIHHVVQDFCHSIGKSRLIDDVSIWLYYTLHVSIESNTSVSNYIPWVYTNRSGPKYNLGKVT